MTNTRPGVYDAAVTVQVSLWSSAIVRIHSVSTGTAACLNATASKATTPSPSYWLSTVSHGIR